MGYVDPYGLFFMNHIWNGVYQATGGWIPSQSTVDMSAGIGDGIIGMMSFGFMSGSDLRGMTGTEGVNMCSNSYLGGRGIGTGIAFGTFAFGSIPSTLVHYTTSMAAARGIAANGLRSSTSGLFGAGTYATSRGATIGRATVPLNARIPTRISNTQGYIRTPFGSYVKPSTIGGRVQLTGAYGIAGMFSNRDTLGGR